MRENFIILTCFFPFFFLSVLCVFAPFAWKIAKESRRRRRRVVWSKVNAGERSFCHPPPSSLLPIASASIAVASAFASRKDFLSRVWRTI